MHESTAQFKNEFIYSKKEWEVIDLMLYFILRQSSS